MNLTYLIYNEEDELEDVVELSDKDYKQFKKKNPTKTIVPADDDFVDDYGSELDLDE